MNQSLQGEYYYSFSNQVYSHDDDEQEENIYESIEDLGVNQESILDLSIRQVKIAIPYHIEQTSFRYQMFNHGLFTFFS